MTSTIEELLDSIAIQAASLLGAKLSRHLLWVETGILRAIRLPQLMSPTMGMPLIDTVIIIIVWHVRCI